MTPCLLRRSLLAVTLFLAADPARSAGNANRDAAPADGEGRVRRHALLVSANDGGSGRAMLRYASKDATAVAHVLAELGGVDAKDAVVVEDATAKRLEDGLAEIRRRLARGSSARQRQEVIFYYSGHSDEDGLLLSGERYTYARLRKAIADLPVDVRLTVLDSCASGQLTLGKGGKRRAPFLVDDSVRAKGHAVITSASADEAAQESERIQGSFFTHYFVTGLRGAADANSDRRVTLSEAYQYAYANTLQRTETTRGGPQHPSYDFQLAGTGDLILTDLRVSAATLFFPKTLEGRYFIRDKDGGLVAEIHKQPGQPVRLGLEPGVYTVVRGEGANYSEGKIDLSETKELDVSGVKLTSVEGEPAVARGTRGAREYKDKRTSFQLVPSFDDDTPEALEQHHFAFGLIGGRSGKLHGWSLALGGYLVDEGGVDGVMTSFGVNWDKGALSGAQLSFGMNYAAGPVSGAQIAMINWTPSAVSGAQVGMINVTRSTLDGAQLGPVNVATGRVTGAQIGYVAYAEDVEGAQIAMVNYAPTVKGAQVGMVDVAENVDGAQVGMVNYAHDVTKAQVSMVGVAHDVPVQVGLVNVATNKAKHQIGLVNYADDLEGVSLGLVSYSRNGTLDVQTYMDELKFSHIAVRMGSKRLYTIYDMADRSASSPGTEDAYAQAGGIGLGTHAAWGDFSLGAELMGFAFTDDEDHEHGEDFYLRLQAIAAYRLFAGLSVYGGPAYGAYLHNEEMWRKIVAPDFKGKEWHNEHTTRWLGGALGLRYTFQSF